MRMMIRRSFCSIVLALALFLISGHAQGPEAASPAASATIAAKKPVFAGACKACPWGILARVTADALSYYGYETTICWVCWSSFGPREMGDKTKPVMPPGAESNAEYIEPPPDAVPDIGATSESNWSFGNLGAACSCGAGCANMTRSPGTNNKAQISANRLRTVPNHRLT